MPNLLVHHAQTAAGVNRNAVGFNRDAARYVATKTSKTPALHSHSYPNPKT